MAIDPIHQFQIINLVPVAKIGNTEIAFTNSAAFMFVAVAGLTAFLVGATAKKSLVPSRLQSAAEISYEFVATTLRSTAGAEGMKFFPFVFTIFMFVLTLNMFGLIPYAFTVTSHIIVTAALAITAIAAATLAGAWFFQLVLDIRPCPLCLEQRYAYYLMIPLGALTALAAGRDAPRTLLLAGLAILNAYRAWTADWRVIVTVLGWMFIIAGIVRIVLPTVATSLSSTIYSAPVAMAVMGIVVLVVGGYLSFEGYRR
jgi:F-type H+-transporting ATPase subunit a